MFFYIAINLIDGERGLISYYEKQKIKEELIIQKQNLSGKLAIIEKKNYLLSEIVNLDYLEILFREKFLVGKPKEQIYNLK
tara:strand:- start:242 stop:484 length:243 start_codon:yes stop_codon:yes gene_type:complete